MVNKILSIIVPSYNMEMYLSKCLRSLIIDNRELFQKLDVVVVNDGSKDRTSEIAHDFEDRYPGVFRVIDKMNGNYGSCINAALPVAEGTFVRVLDADDSFDSLGFSRFLKCLDGCGADLVISDYDVVDESGDVMEHRTYDFPADRVFSLKEFSATSRYISMHAYTYRTDMIRSTGYKQLEGVSYSDSEWILLPLVGVRKIIYCPETVYRYLRGRAGQTMETNQIAKNFWMRASLALDMLGQFERFDNSVDGEASDYLRSRLLAIVATIYRAGIFGYNGLPVNLDLWNFDNKLRTKFSSIYCELEEECYCKRIPYRYIHWWRKKSKWRHVMELLCKVYSGLAKKI